MACVKQFPIDSKKGEGRAVGDESVVEMRRQWYRLRREGEGLTHMSAHTRTLRVTEGGRALGHRTLHTSTVTRTREAWPDHRALWPGGPGESPERPMVERAVETGWQAGRLRLGWRLWLRPAWHWPGWTQWGSASAETITRQSLSESPRTNIRERETRGHTDWQCRDTVTTERAHETRGLQAQAETLSCL